MAQAKQSAALRYQLARAAGVEDRLVGKNHSAESVDLVGIKAEIAVAKLFNADFEANALGIDCGVDLYIKGLRREMGVQVKSSHHQNAEWLLINADPDSDWDAAIFVVPTDQDDSMRIVGAISKSRCIDALETVDLGHGPGNGVRVEHLRAISVLWRSLNA